jgi:hypothetical protein
MMIFVLNKLDQIGKSNNCKNNSEKEYKGAYLPHVD